MLQFSQFTSVMDADLRKVLREPFFWFIFLTPLLMAIGGRFFLPYIADQFVSINLAQYFPVIIGLLILTPPMYYGLIIALQLLEEREENVLIAIAVTPLKLHTYLGTRVAMYTLISIPLIIFVHEIINVQEIALGELILIAIAASLNTPMFVMLMAALAKNQLEGFVIVKGVGFLVLFPLVMYFVPDYWHLICGILPTYWPIIAYYTAISATGSTLFFYFAICMAVVTQLFATRLLYRRFESGLLSG